jgi:hypothetical protein
METAAGAENRRDTAAFPPAGFLSEVQAAARMGISPKTLAVWKAKGQFGYAGELILAPNGRWWRLYAAVEVDRAHQAMKRAAVRLICLLMFPRHQPSPIISCCTARSALGPNSAAGVVPYNFFKGRNAWQ